MQVVSILNNPPTIEGAHFGVSYRWALFHRVKSLSLQVEIVEQMAKKNGPLEGLGMRAAAISYIWATNAKCAIIQHEQGRTGLEGGHWILNSVWISWSYQRRDRKWREGCSEIRRWLWPLDVRLWGSSATPNAVGWPDGRVEQGRKHRTKIHTRDSWKGKQHVNEN